MTAEMPPNPLENLPPTIDQVLSEAMVNAVEAQTALQSAGELNDDTVGEVLEPVHELWQSTGYAGAHVRITGKLRLACKAALKQESVTSLLNRLPAGSDEHGKYWLANNERLVSAMFTVATGKRGDIDKTGRVGLSLVVPEDFDDDIGLDYDTGELMVYPGEVVAAEFLRPNAAVIEGQLQYHFPELYQQLQQCLPGVPDPSPRQILHFLNEFSIPGDTKVYHEYPIIARLNKYIFSELGFDDAKYTLMVQGNINSVSDEEADVDSRRDKYSRYRLRAYIRGVQMEPDRESEDDKVLKPHLLLAVDVRGDDGYYAFLVPPETILSLASDKTQHSQFGKQALMVFSNLDALDEYFAEPILPASSEKDANMHDAFAYLTAGLELSVPAIDYNYQYRCRGISLERDMNTVVAGFAQLVEAHGMQYPDMPLRQPEYAKIDKQMTATYDHLQDLHTGDQLATRGEVFFMDLAPDGSSSAVPLHGEFSLSGNFQRFDVIEHPVIMLLPDVGLRMMNGGIDATVCAVLTDCKVVDGDGVDQQHEFRTKEILVPVTANNTDHFIKLEQLEE